MRTKPHVPTYISTFQKPLLMKFFPKMFYEGIAVTEEFCVCVVGWGSEGDFILPF